MMPRLPAALRTPAYVLDVARLRQNLSTMARIKGETGCRILLACKAFAMPRAFPILREVLDGVTASGEYEARLGREEFGKEVHVYSPAYTEAEMGELRGLADHIYFNSPAQLRRFLPIVNGAPSMKVGFRVNPELSVATVGGSLYDPCAPFSRFGTTRDHLGDVPWEQVSVLHAHALCQSPHEGSVRLIEHVASHLGEYVRRVAAVNFGGGHYINSEGYDVGALISAINRFKSEFGVDVILEPGAAVVLDAGWLVASVLDIHRNEKEIAILDASASCHMPDVLEAPYRPPVVGAAEPGAYPHTYILAGRTCMAGDIIGEYSFPQALSIGRRIVFGDMMQYSFVKNNSFNGAPLPDLAMLDEHGMYRIVRRFGYDDFKGKLD